MELNLIPVVIEILLSASRLDKVSYVFSLLFPASIYVNCVKIYEDLCV